MNYLLKIAQKLGELITKRTQNQISIERFDVQKAKPNPNGNNSLQVENRMMLLLSLSCNIAGEKGYINFQLSDGLLEEMQSLGFFSQTSEDRIKFQELSNIKSKQIEDNIFIEFGRFNPKDVELEAGKILILDKKEIEGLNVVFENQVIHTGKVVAIDENFGIQIEQTTKLNEIFYDEEDFLSIELGSTYLSKEEITALGKDSYILLRQRAGELTKILHSGKLVAYGEACIAGDLFAMRVVEVK